MISVKFWWTFPDSVIFLPHSYLGIVVWLFIARISEVLAECGLYLYGKYFFVSYQDAPYYGLSVGAIALGYPAQEAGPSAARKQNDIVRM